MTSSLPFSLSASSMERTVPRWCRHRRDRVVGHRQHQPVAFKLSNAFSTLSGHVHDRPHADKSITAMTVIFSCARWRLDRGLLATTRTRIWRIAGTFLAGLEVDRAPDLRERQPTSASRGHRTLAGRANSPMVNGSLSRSAPCSPESRCCSCSMSPLLALPTW